MAAEPSPESFEAVPAAYRVDLRLVESPESHPYADLAESYPNFDNFRNDTPAMDWEHTRMLARFTFTGRVNELLRKEFFLSSDGRFAMARPLTQRVPREGAGKLLELNHYEIRAEDNHHADWYRLFRGQDFREISPAEHAELRAALPRYYRGPKLLPAD